jgi:hypothetical protein
LYHPPPRVSGFWTSSGGLWNLKSGELSKVESSFVMKLGRRVRGRVRTAVLRVYDKGMRFAGVREAQFKHKIRVFIDLNNQRF